MYFLLNILYVYQNDTEINQFICWLLKEAPLYRSVLSHVAYNLSGTDNIFYSTLKFTPSPVKTLWAWQYSAKTGDKMMEEVVKKMNEDKTQELSRILFLKSRLQSVGNN